MQQSNRKLLSYILAFTLALSSTMLSSNVAAYDRLQDKTTAGTMLADTFMVRPFMLVSTVVGTAAFIVTLPFSLIGGNTGESAKTLVGEPFMYTFARPLGEL